MSETTRRQLLVGQFTSARSLAGLAGPALMTLGGIDGLLAITLLVRSQPDVIMFLFFMITGAAFFLIGLFLRAAGMLLQSTTALVEVEPESKRNMPDASQIARAVSDVHRAIEFAERAKHERGAPMGSAQQRKKALDEDEDEQR